MAQILVIEDNPASLQLMIYLLAAYGHTAIPAKNGETGIELAESQTPDLILCDIHLPHMNGYEVCRRVKSDAALKSVPIIAVTAYAMVGDREKLLAAGFDSYISKPINPETFNNYILPFIDASAAKAPDVHSEIVTNGGRRFFTNPESSAADSAATILVVDNMPRNIELLRLVLETAGYAVTEANSVKSALSSAENLPDLVLCDIHMPGADGYDLLNAIKANERLSQIPVVLLSSSIPSRLEVDLANEASGFITRPIEPAALIEKIETVLTATAGRRESRRLAKRREI